MTPADFDRRAGQTLREFRAAPPPGAWDELQRRLPTPAPTRERRRGWWPGLLLVGLLAAGGSAAVGLGRIGHATPGTLSALPVPLRGHLRAYPGQTSAASHADATRVPPSRRSEGFASATKIPGATAQTTEAEIATANRQSPSARSSSGRGASTASEVERLPAKPLTPPAEPIDPTAGPGRKAAGATAAGSTLEPLADDSQASAANASGPDEGSVTRAGAAILGPVDALPLGEVASLRASELPGVSSAVVARGTPGWSWSLRADARLWRIADPDRIRADLRERGATFDGQTAEGEREGSDPPLRQVDVFAEPAVLLTPALEATHRSGVTAGLRLAAGAERVDLGGQGRRLWTGGIGATLGYRRSFGRWTPYAYGVVEHLRRQRISVFVEASEEEALQYANALASDAGQFGVLGLGGDDDLDLSRGFSDGLPVNDAHPFTSLGLGLGLDYRLTARWHLGVSSEYLHGRVVASTGLRLGL